MKSKTLIKIGILCFIAGISLISLRNESFSGFVAKEKIVYEDYKNISLYFCEKDDCESVIADQIDKAAKEDCAFYDVDLEKIVNNLIKDPYRLVTDNVCKTEISHRKDGTKALMHNKFCIYDNKIISTGSFNPKKSSALKDNNNLIVIESDYLAKNYEDEFNELWNGVFGSGDKVKYPIIKYGNITIENYFCPEDKCEQRLIEKLNTGKEIYFLIFSLTDTDVAQKLIDMHNSEIKIQGVVEKQRINMEYEQYKNLKSNGIDIKADSNKYLLHDKTWIIDDTIIIGSYNPTSSGNTRNDENMLIIKDAKLADKMKIRFNEIYAKAQAI